MCVRVFQALRSNDPSAALMRLPSPQSIRLLVDRAREHGVAQESVDEARKAIGRLEQIIGAVGGRKSNLDTLLSSEVLEDRAKLEHGAKQNVFRGMSQLLGVQVDCALVAYFVRPSENAGWCDDLAVYGARGLRRLRAELPILLGGRNSTRDDVDEMPDMIKSLHSPTIESNGLATAIKEFCSDPFPNVQIVREGSTLLYTLPKASRSAYDELSLIFASDEKEASPLLSTETMHNAQYAFAPRNPSKHMLLDVFVHKDVWLDVHPSLVMARSGPGHNPNRATMNMDLVDHAETIQNHGFNAAAIHTEKFPRYAELVRHVHQQMKWTLGDFRLYRCIVRYPVVGLWYSMQFRLPVAHHRHH